MNDVPVEENAKEEAPDPRQQIVLGIDEEGFLNVKVHVGVGKWVLWGILDDAKNLVLGYFVQLRKQEEGKKLVRPTGFLNKWRR